jgi:sugar phosphate isomerase/epimerase
MTSSVKIRAEEENSGMVKKEETMEVQIGFTASPKPVEEYFKFAADNGFRRLDLGCENPVNFPQTFTKERIRRIKRLSEKYGIRYGVHSASFVNTAEIMPTVRKASEQHLLEYVRLSKELSAEYCVIHCGYHFNLFKEVVMENLLRTLRAAVRLAEKLRLLLVIENMNVVHPDCEIVYLGVTVDELAQVFEAISSPYLGLALDLGHANLLPRGAEHFIETFPDKIYHLHISDNNGILDQHLRVGEGNINFKSIFGRLEGIGFAGTATLEVSSDEDRIESRRRLLGLLKPDQQ